MIDTHPETELANIQDGKAPKSRLSTATQAQQLGNLLVNGNTARSFKKARLKGAIDGNPPYNPAKLKAAGQSWRTNCNFGGAEAAVSAGVTPFADLINGAPYYAEVQTEYGTSRERVEYSQVLTEQFDYILRDWEGFDFQFQAMIFDMVAYGKGFMVWPDLLDWKFEWVPEFLVYVPERTKAYTGKVPMIMLRVNYELHELWEKIEDEETAKQAGWNVEAVKRAIESAYPPPSDGTQAHPSYELIQQKLKENELYEGYRSKVVQVYHFFVVEFDGKVTELIVPETNTARKEESTTPEFLLKSSSKHEKLSDVIASFFFECSDGTWNGVRGLAQKIFPLIELQNRTLGAFFDNVFMRSGISLQATSAEAIQKLSLINIGPFNIIPPGFTVQQSTIMGDLSGSMEADRTIEQKITEYTGTYKPRLDKPVGNPRTAREVEIDNERSATLSDNAVRRFYRNCDRFFHTLFFRVAKSDEFKKRLVDHGIPKDLISKVVDKVCAVRAYRAIGNGNAFMRRNSLQQLAQIVPMMPETGRQAWVRDSIASITNRESVERYAPMPDESVPTDDTSIAMLENAAMKIGSPVVWTETQNNVIHAQVHLQAGGQAAASLQKGGNPIDILHFIDAIGAHSMVHIQKLASDPVRQNEFQVLQSQWKELAGIADGLRKQIEQQARQAAEQQQERQSQEQPGMDPDTQAKMMKTDADIRMKEAKNQQLMRQKEEKHRQNMALSDATTAASMQREQAKVGI